MNRKTIIAALACAGLLTFATPTAASAGECVFICPDGQPTSPFADTGNWPEDKILPPRDLDLDKWAEQQGAPGERPWWRPEPVAVGTGSGGGGGGSLEPEQHGCFIICW